MVNMKFLIYSAGMTLQDYRLYIFVGLVALLAVIEFAWPIYRHKQRTYSRWGTNFGLSFFSVALVKYSYLPAAAAFALYIETQNIGLFNWLNIDGALAIILSVILLDVAIYGQHVLSHKWQFLWRFHRVHHSDGQMDVSTAVRFHPIEIFLSLFYKFVLISLLGAPALAVVIFELILSSGALFNHSNIRFGKRIDRYLQYIVVTPNMHRIHHSDDKQQTDSNYGFSISLWDRLFSSYTANYDADKDINIGLKESAGQKTQNFIWCLKFPFVGKNPRVSKARGK